MQDFKSKIHFVGIGGIGMSGIAEVMFNLGYNVQGSDLFDSQNVQRLRELGVKVFIGHNKKNISNVSLIVYSSAVKNDNPELEYAKENNLRIIKRADMLADLIKYKYTIAVGGTHGKTTTTSLVSAILYGADFDPTIVNGGIINYFSSNARLGSGDWAIVEADESDGTFLKLPRTVAIVTNVDEEHLDYYGDFFELKKAFIKFINGTPDLGFAVLCNDNENIRSLFYDINVKKIITYGIDSKSDIMAKNIKIKNDGTSFDVYVSEKIKSKPFKIKNIYLPMIGIHNVLNALAAISVSLQLKVSDEKIKCGLASFTGVNRRFSKIGVFNGITIFDDYGHHPVEIKAVLDAAKNASPRNVIAVMQPHRYSRLSLLFDEFCKCFESADHIIISKVYAAGENPIINCDRDSLVRALISEGNKKVTPLGSPEELAGIIYNLARNGDWVVCLGAGDITSWAKALPDNLERISNSNLKGSL